ncbi:transcription factor Adf-1-like [Culicoides brevitarsis]|uniref:transcription factor Adf-1-like n=1 Tax=Culicoides brevitarsis TaxID=469753 RepID=UPI00307C62DD
MISRPTNTMAAARIMKQRKKRIGQWSELDLINEIQKNTILYDKTLKDYRKPGPTEAAWESISKTLGANIEDLKKRWKSLRDTFIKYYRMEIEQNSPMNTRQKVWKYYNNLDYLRSHVELYRIDDERVTGGGVVATKISNCNDEQSQGESEYETSSRQEYSTPTNTKSKTNTIKVLVEAEGNDPYKTAEYTLYETNQDVELDDLENTNNDQIYLEHIDTDEYQIDNEPMETSNMKKEQQQQKKVEIISQPASNDPDEKFLMSCLPVLKRVNAQKNALLKLKIQMLLYEVEFGSADDSPDTKKRKF